MAQTVLMVQMASERVRHGVVQRQQARWALAALGALAIPLGWAAPAGASESAAAPAAAAPVDPDRSYALPLGAAYAIGPLLAFGIGGLLSEAEASDNVAVAVAAPMFLAPAAVHLYQGASDRVAVSLVSMVGVTFAGTLAGGVAGYLENQIVCDPEQDSECQDRGTGTTILGAAIGTIVGYATSAVLDVALRSSTPGQSAPAHGAPEQAARAGSARLWLAPLGTDEARSRSAAVRRSPSANPLAADGLMIGLTLRL
jgi:hypothetical protein